MLFAFFVRPLVRGPLARRPTDLPLVVTRAAAAFSKALVSAAVATLLALCWASTSHAACGNGPPAEVGEQCDDGNANDCDACHNDCTNNTNACGDGHKCGTENCDLGPSNGANTSCCTSTCHFRLAGRECRSLSDVCDKAEVCTGSSGDCPVDSVAATTMRCRDPNGTCDRAENCDGVNKSCPADAVAPAGTTCRQVMGACDQNDTCDGTTKACADTVQPSTYVCRAAVGFCDNPEMCDGQVNHKSCPGDPDAAKSRMKLDTYIRHAPKGAALDYLLKDTPVDIMYRNKKEPFYWRVKSRTSDCSKLIKGWVPVKDDGETAVAVNPADSGGTKVKAFKSSSSRVLFRRYKVVAEGGLTIRKGPFPLCPMQNGTCTPEPKKCVCPIRGAAAIGQGGFVGIATTTNPNHPRLPAGGPVDYDQPNGEKIDYVWVTRSCPLGATGWVPTKYRRAPGGPLENTLETNHQKQCKKTCCIRCNSSGSAFRYDLSHYEKPKCKNGRCSTNPTKSCTKDNVKSHCPRGDNCRKWARAKCKGASLANTQYGWCPFSIDDGTWGKCTLTSGCSRKLVNAASASNAALGSFAAAVAVSADDDDDTPDDDCNEPLDDFEIDDECTAVDCPQGATFCEDFENGANPELQQDSIGMGITGAVSGGSFDIDVGEDPQDDEMAGEFAAVLTHECKLRGDFDIQVDFDLQEWPERNGVRVALVADDSVERISYGIGAELSEVPSEVFAIRFGAGGVQGVTGAADSVGQLRLVREGSTLTAYFAPEDTYDTWVQLYSGQASEGDVSFGIRASSRNAVFGGAPTDISLDNLIVNQGELTGPGVATVFVDENFVDADWSYQKIVDQTPGQTATVAAQQLLTGGNPDAYRSTTHNWCDDGTGIQDIAVLHLRDGFVWDPAVDGPIDSLTLSYDVIFAPFGNPNAVGYHLAVAQNGHAYGRTAFATSPSWTNVSASGVDASDFVAFTSGAPPLDFSASGAPMQFGYVTSNGTAFAQCVTTTSGIDNFTLTITPSFTPSCPPPAGSVPLASDETWGTFDADPAGSGANALGSAQNVCANGASPPSCPPGATIFSFPSVTWTTDLSSVPGASWIWAPGVTGATTPANGATFFFSKTINVPGSVVSGSVSVDGDNFAEVRVNGTSIGTHTGTPAWQLESFDITSFLYSGANILTVRGENANESTCAPGCTYSQNPAGIVFGGRITYEPE